MSNYLSHTPEDAASMLNTVGVSNVEELYSDIPSSLKLKKWNLQGGVSEQEAAENMADTAAMNKVFHVVMRGAGSYRHFVPPVVTALSSHPKFLTAYTPYQSEMSQGILQAIFEYQSYIAALTGMDVSNASVYSGSTAAAEAVLMTRERGRDTVIVCDNASPDTIQVLKTYLEPKGMRLVIIKHKDGLFDTEALKASLSSETACVYCEQPNYFGLIEDGKAIGELTHGAGAKYIMSANPISLAVLPSPREQGADIAVGEGQPLGLPMNFGGPGFGFMACTSAEMRKMPGRIVGETRDKNGNKAYVLTLQAREQHIRREKASSNICSNQAHCALTAAIYLAAMGKTGLKEAADASVTLAHYAKDMFTAIPGVKLKYHHEFFHEFVTTTEGKADKICDALLKAGILPGLPLSDSDILWCMTEYVKVEDIDRAAELIRRAL